MVHVPNCGMRRPPRPASTQDTHHLLSGIPPSGASSTPTVVGWHRAGSGHIAYPRRRCRYCRYLRYRRARAPPYQRRPRWCHLGRTLRRPWPPRPTR